MPLPVELESIAGAQELYDWFGYWPDFHDAEVTKFQVELGKPSSLVIHTWEMSSRVDTLGYYERTKPVVVEFVLDGVSTLKLADPWVHSILLEIVIEKSDIGFRLDLSSSYGLAGTIEAQGISLHITPGKPTQSLSS